MAALINPTAASVRVRRGRVDARLGRQGERFQALPVGQGAEGRAGGQQVVQVGGAGAGQAGDDDRRFQLDLVDLGMAGQQVGEQQPVLEQLQQLGVEVDDAGVVQPVDVAQRGEVDVESFSIISWAEIGQAGIGTGLRVQRLGIATGTKRPSRPSCRGSVGRRG